MFKGLYSEYLSHHTMIQDEHRTLGFYNAIKSKISPDDVVVDFGSGSGVLAVLCAKLGASKVYAVEQNKQLHTTIEALAEANGVRDKIEIHSTTSDVFIENFTGKVDLLVSEGIGDNIFESRLVYDFLVFKDKFDVKKTIPEQFELYCYPEYIQLNRLDFLKMESTLGLNLEPVTNLPFADLDSSYFDIGKTDAYFNLPATDKEDIKLLKFSKKEELLDYDNSGKIKCKIHMNTIPSHGEYIMVFFKIKLSNDIELTNSPTRKKAKHSYYQRLVSTAGIKQNKFKIWIDYKMHKVNIENIPYPNIGVSND